MKKIILFLSLSIVAIKLFAQEHNGHKYVDMGVSVYWSPVNMGATIPEGSGEFYAWGETTTKPYGCYTRKNYRYYSPGYVDDDGFDRPDGITDIGKDISGTKYDAAHVHWGGKWRMPTREEVKELNKNCTSQRTWKNGVPGIKLTSKITGNWLFIPQVQIKHNSNTELKKIRFWTSTSEFLGYSYAFDFGTTEGSPVFFGIPIRPVFTK